VPGNLRSDFAVAKDAWFGPPGFSDRQRTNFAQPANLPTDHPDSSIKFSMVPLCILRCE
jgi:hypothetical protein